jgi:hypothetical protein
MVNFLKNEFTAEDRNGDKVCLTPQFQFDCFGDRDGLPNYGQFWSVCGKWRGERVNFDFFAPGSRQTRAGVVKALNHASAC